MVLFAFAEQSIRLIPDGTMFLHIAIILVMIWVLNRTFFRPINRVLQARERNRGGATNDADAILDEAVAKRREYDAGIREARNRGYEVIERERAEAVNERHEAMARAKEESARRVADEKADLEAQTNAARAEIAAEAERLSDRIADNILKARA